MFSGIHNYEVAARLRDSLKSFEEEEPVIRLRALMKEAVVNDKFEVRRRDASNGGVSFPGCKGRCVMSTLFLFDPLRPTFYAPLYVHKNYEEADRLRDSLKSFEEEEPVLRLRGLMKELLSTTSLSGGQDSKDHKFAVWWMH